MNRLLVQACLAVTVLAGPGALAWGPPEPDGAAVCADADLIAAVKAAARRGVGPEMVELVVGRRAVINTTRDDRAIVESANLEADGEGPTTGEGKARPLPELAKVRHVVYWGRPVEARNPRMVGIAWDEDGTARVFFFVVYPP
jgi:hypothetical protein